MTPQHAAHLEGLESLHPPLISDAAALWAQRHPTETRPWQYPQLKTDLAFICLLKQTDLIPSPFYYDINNSSSVLSTLKRFHFIAVLQTVTWNLTRVSKQRFLDINRWGERTTGLSDSQDKLYLTFPTLARKLKMEINADFYKCL